MADIKTYATPPMIYRYRPFVGDTVIDREIAAIVQGYIYCPRFDQMNDPMEGLHRESVLFQKADDYARRRASVDQAKNDLGIASLSEVFDHEPMWAHYAQSFQGICIAYSFNRLLAELPDTVEFVRMAYNEEAPVLLKGRKTAKHLAKLALSTKTVRWSSEREWRLIQPGPGPARYHDKQCVRRVYVGARIADAALSKLRRAMGGLNIPVLRMQVDKYEIEFEKLGRIRPKPAPRAKTVLAKSAKRVAGP